jgi:RNA polymerase sigma-70 factor (ECF subfamily)
MAWSVEQGLSLLDRLDESGELADYYLFHAARADLLRRAGQLGEAYTAYERALTRCQNSVEQAFLRRRLEEIQVARCGPVK